MVTEQELLDALRVVVDDESLGDFIYSVRERTHEDEDWTGSSWDHPRTVAFGEAVDVLTRYLREHGVEQQP